VFLIGYFLLNQSQLVAKSSYLTLKDVEIKSTHPWKKDIVTTYFWIGQGSTSYSDTTNYKSAWDGKWSQNYGGADYPGKRIKQDGSGSLPKNFAPRLNPFYVALPFNDIKYPKLAQRYVPWWNHDQWRKQPYRSQCKGRWVMIEYRGKVAFAQWEDVGPIRYDHPQYVFGTERPTHFNRAGLDVSPAVKDYLGLTGLDKTSWRFVEDDEVPYGPWIKYGEQAILFSAIRNKTPSSTASSRRRM
jgi:hypothetical protein